MLDYTLGSDAHFSTIGAPYAPFVEDLLNVDVGPQVEMLGFAFVVTPVRTQAKVATLFKELQNANVAHKVAADTTNPRIKRELLTQVTDEVVPRKI